MVVKTLTSTVSTLSLRTDRQKQTDGTKSESSLFAIYTAVYRNATGNKTVMVKV